MLELINWSPTINPGFPPLKREVNVRPNIYFLPLAPSLQPAQIPTAKTITHESQLGNTAGKVYPVRVLGFSETCEIRTR